jgi:GNAT superfamily N-acetyltransferase
MALDVRPFDALRATEAEIDEYSELRGAAFRVDFPEMTPPMRAETAARLAAPPLHLGERLMWLARVDGRLAGVATVNLPVEGDDHIIIAHIVVHPDLRRRGFGTQILRTVESAARGRTEIQGWQVTEGSPGDHWTKGLGFRTVHTTVLQILTFAEADSGRWDRPVSDGYRLARWVGKAPEELVESYAKAMSTLGDSDVGSSGLTLADWSADRLRRIEADRVVAGIENRTILAVTDDGEVAGVTELEQRPQNPVRLVQGATAVLAAHRGHGLGLAMKAAMLRWFTADHDGLEEVWTSTGADNTHMVEVNHRLGFKTARRFGVVSREI